MHIRFNRFSAQAKQDLPKKVIAVAGNPNVGKSTLFNHLTHGHQHTGNWAGKTVSLARGQCQTRHYRCQLVDLPGTYSLTAHSAEEAVARDYICSGEADAVLLVCDATCLERNLTLILQILEITKKAVVCVNLLDEAAKKGISIQLPVLSRMLGVPVVGVTARKPKTLNAVTQALDQFPFAQNAGAFSVPYPAPIRQARELLVAALKNVPHPELPLSWLALRLLESAPEAASCEKPYASLWQEEAVYQAWKNARDFLWEKGISAGMLRDQIAAALVQQTEIICQKAVSCLTPEPSARDRKLDRLFTGKWTGYPLMLLLLALFFWITIVGANYPSAVLAAALFSLEEPLQALLAASGAAPWFCDLVIAGIYHVVAWVISIMLPPMAIFFPLFTLLEDAGYLPRVAYNLDRPFQCCRSCGKQALTMCAGLGCNAVGVTGCRIIDSPRERLIAVLTNNFVPCNGRFPTMIALITLFFVSPQSAKAGSFWAALGLTILILIGVLFTFAFSKLLSYTLLKGTPSSFTLELPPYRRPEIGKVILRSLLDRTVFVLGRAICAAAPAGLLIWLLVHCHLGDTALLTVFSEFLNPFARQIGLDGVLLMAFLLGLPANEIVLPISLMAYLAQNNLMSFGDLTQLHTILSAHGWTWITAGSFLLFSLLHWPCATALLTIRKETGSWKWTGLAFLLPTATGIAVCFVFSHLAAFFL